MARPWMGYGHRFSHQPMTRSLATTKYFFRLKSFFRFFLFLNRINDQILPAQNLKMPRKKNLRDYTNKQLWKRLLVRDDCIYIPILRKRKVKFDLCSFNTISSQKINFTRKNNPLIQGAKNFRGVEYKNFTKAHFYYL